MVPWLYTFGVLMATLLGWGSWLLVLNKMSPFISGSLALGFFYGSLFVATAGTFTLTYQGATTQAPIASTATAATVKAALDALGAAIAAGLAAARGIADTRSQGWRVTSLQELHS